VPSTVGCIPWVTLEDLLAVDPSARTFQERLQAERAASLAVLLSLKQRLTATDCLIDQVVYTVSATFGIAACRQDKLLRLASRGIIQPTGTERY
jgi:hypothetical protein